MLIHSIYTSFRLLRLQFEMNIFSIHASFDLQKFCVVFKAEDIARLDTKKRFGKDIGGRVRMELNGTACNFHDKVHIAGQGRSIDG